MNTLLPKSCFSKRKRLCSGVQGILIQCDIFKQVSYLFSFFNKLWLLHKSKIETIKGKKFECIFLSLELCTSWFALRKYTYSYIYINICRCSGNLVARINYKWIILCMCINSVKANLEYRESETEQNRCFWN